MAKPTRIWEIFSHKTVFGWSVIGAIVPGVFLALGGVVLAVDWFPHNLLFAQILFFVSALFFVAKIVLISVESQDSFWSIIIFVLVVCGIILGATGYVIWQIQIHKVELEAAKHPKAAPQEPHISAELSVDSTNPKKITFRVMLENVGPVAISSLQTFVHSDSMSWMILIPGQSTIAPHEKTELASGDFPVFKRPKQVNVYLLYESDLNDVHHSEYSFLVPEVVAGVQPILPTFTKEGSGDPLGEDKLLATQGMTAFQQNVGTIVFWFPEKKPDGSPNQIRIWAKNRAVAVNSATHKAAVWTRLGRVEKSAEADLGATSNGVHAIAVVWDDSKGTFAIKVDQGPLIQAVHSRYIPPPIKH